MQTKQDAFLFIARSTLEAYRFALLRLRYRFSASKEVELADFIVKIADTVTDEESLTAAKTALASRIQQEFDDTVNPPRPAAESSRAGTPEAGASPTYKVKKSEWL